MDLTDGHHTLHPISEEQTLPSEAFDTIISDSLHICWAHTMRQGILHIYLFLRKILWCSCCSRFTDKDTKTQRVRYYQVTQSESDLIGCNVSNLSLEPILDLKKGCQNSTTVPYTSHQAPSKVQVLHTINIGAILLTKDLIQISLTCPQMSFYCSQIQSRIAPCIPLRSSSAYNSSLFLPCLSWSWQFWRILGQLFYKNVPQFGFI